MGEINPGGCMQTFIYHRQDIQDVACCVRCLKFLKVGNHFGFFCDICEGKGFVCGDCMSKEIVKIDMCYGGCVYYAMEGEKIISFDQTAMDTILDAGDVVVSSAGDSYTMIKERSI